MIGLSIVNQELTRHGFNGSNSIVGHFLTKAKADKKMVVSLERSDTFLNILSALPDVQAEWCLLQAMVEAAYYSTNLNEIVEAWKTGNVKRLDDINRTTRKVCALALTQTINGMMRRNMELWL